MVALQIISKIIQTSDLSIYEDNLLTPDYFIGYEKEIQFILDHKEKYGNVPDKETFLFHFTNEEGKTSIQLVEVNESDRYLIDTIREEYLYYKSVPVIQKAADLLKTNSNEAVEYIMSNSELLQPNYSLGGIDIISQADFRLKEYKERQEDQSSWFLESGFKELDEIIHGLQRGEELFVLFARINQGKSWVLEKICTHVWQTGFNVGYVSPEMSASNVGFRFDTLLKNYSNKDLMWGNKHESDISYEDYINDLKTKNNKFIVATPLDFERKITVSKLRNWVKQYKLDLIAIDGITYMSDERGNLKDNKTTKLTNISEDLMSLSMELKIPVLVVVQANRNGAGDEGTLELETIRDSDGIAANASKVISIKQKVNQVLELCIKKQRNGPVGGKLTYSWSIDTGEFTFCPNYDDVQPNEKSDKQIKETKKKFNDSDKRDIF